MPGLPVLDLEIIKCRVLLISNFSQWRFQKIVFPPGSPAYTLFGTGFWECWPWLTLTKLTGRSLGLASSSLSLVSSMMTHYVCHRRCHLWNRKVIVMDAEEAKAEGIYTIEVLLTKTLVGWCWATHIIGKHSSLWVWHFQGSELQKTRTCWYCQALLHGV